MTIPQQFFINIVQLVPKHWGQSWFPPIKVSVLKLSKSK